MNKKEISNVLFKVKNQIYGTETISCPICYKKGGKRLSFKDRYGLHYYQVICDCGLCYLDTRLNLNSYIDFYENHYYDIYSSLSKEEYFLQEYKQGEKIYNFIKKINKNCKVLEVGCGAGGILKYFKDRGCENVMGLELDQKYIDFAKKNEIFVKKGMISDVDQEFDLIIYSHVFEHLLDLNKELEFIKTRLSKNGILFIEVPSILELNDYYFNVKRFYQNAHTFNFTKESLLNLLNKNNFEELKINDFVTGIFRHNESFYRDPISCKKHTLKHMFINRMKFYTIGLIRLTKDNSLIFLKKILKKLRLFNSLKQLKTKLQK